MLNPKYALVCRELENHFQERLICHRASRSYVFEGLGFPGRWFESCAKTYLNHFPMSVALEHFLGNVMLSCPSYRLCNQALWCQI